MADKVATLTTIATPHHGSKTMDALFKYLRPLVRLFSLLTDAVYKLAGDQKPNTFETLRFFTTPEADAFNAAVSDDECVRYQSYGFYLNHWYGEPLLALPHLIVKRIEGENDGLLSTKTMEWGQCKAVYTGNGCLGVSHWQEVDLWSAPMSKKSGNQLSDITDLYLNIAKDLAQAGY